MNRISYKQTHSVSRLTISDQREVKVLEEVVQELLSENMLNEYVALRKENCELGAIQTRLLEESERPFITFLREKASEYIQKLIEEKIMSYETGSNELYKMKALASINGGISVFTKSPSAQNK
jgi:hypothetical protein